MAMGIVSIYSFFKERGSDLLTGECFWRTINSLRADGGAFDFIFPQDFAGSEFLAVEVLVGAAIRAEGSAFERDAGEETTGARVGEDLARRTTSVAAWASRPLGPAAAAASAPSLTLLFISDSAPRGFMTSRTKSVSCPPSWKPIFAPSSAYMAGALQCPLKCGRCGRS